MGGSGESSGAELGLQRRSNLGSEPSIWEQLARTGGHERTNTRQQELARLTQLAYMTQFTPPNTNAGANAGAKAGANGNSNPAAGSKGTQSQLQSMLQMQEHLRQQIDALSKLRSQVRTVRSS